MSAFIASFNNFIYLHRLRQSIELYLYTFFRCLFDAERTFYAARFRFNLENIEIESPIITLIFMISDLDKTLIALLRSEFSNPKNSDSLPFDLSFAMPKKDFVPSSSQKITLNCYLYDISEERELRSLERLYTYTSEGIEAELAPVQIKLSYCITAWSPATSTNSTSSPEIDEHELLGRVLQVLLKYPVLPPEILVGTLAKQAPIYTFVAMPNDKKSTSEFWNAIGGQLRPSLDYIVTISLDYQTPIEEGPMVTTLLTRQGVGTDIGTANEQIQGTPDEHIQIGGLITDNSSNLKPINQAWVLLTESGQLPAAGQIQITNPQGRFIFSGLKPGNYDLRVRAISYQENGRAITVPSPTGEYNIQLQHS